RRLPRLGCLGRSPMTLAPAAAPIPSRPKKEKAPRSLRAPLIVQVQFDLVVVVPAVVVLVTVVTAVAVAVVIATWVAVVAVAAVTVGDSVMHLLLEASDPH